jgi:hypothetical protein
MSSLSGKKRKNDVLTDSEDDAIPEAKNHSNSSDELCDTSMEESSDDGNETDDSIVDNSPIKAPPPLNEKEEIELALQEGNAFAQNLEGIEKNGRLLRKPREKKEDAFKIEVARVQFLDQIKIIHKELKSIQKERPELNLQLPKIPSFKSTYQEVLDEYATFDALYIKTMKDIGESEEDEEEDSDEEEDTSSFSSSDEDISDESDLESEESDESM